MPSEFFLHLNNLKIQKHALWAQKIMPPAFHNDGILHGLGFKDETLKFSVRALVHK